MRHAGFDGFEDVVASLALLEGDHPVDATCYCMGFSVNNQQGITLCVKMSSKLHASLVGYRTRMITDPVSHPAALT